MVAILQAAEDQAAASEEITRETPAVADDPPRPLEDLLKELDALVGLKSRQGGGTPTDQFPQGAKDARRKGHARASHFAPFWFFMVIPELERRPSPDCWPRSIDRYRFSVAAT